MNQLFLLLEQSHHWPVQPEFFVTTLPVSAKAFEKYGHTYAIGECNRYKPLSVFKVVGCAFKIIIKERPDIIVTTGSMPVAIFCLIAKLFGAKTVWIDSIANARKLSMSGWMMRHFADLILSQWPDVAAKYSNVEYVGELI